MNFPLPPRFLRILAGAFSLIASCPALWAQTISQTITFSPFPGKFFGDSAFSAGASASSGLPVSYVSSDTSVATISGGIITIIGVGITDITASQAGDGNYLAAADVTQTLTVNSVRQSVAGTTVTLDFEEGVVGNPLSYANNWSTSDPAARPDGYARDGANQTGFLGGYNVPPSALNTQLTYGFDPGSSDRYVFGWTQNISSSSSDFPGDDIFGWKFLSGSNTAFSIQFLNDSSTGRDLLVQGYDDSGTALTQAAGQDNDWFIDRDDANDFRVTADLVAKKWALEVFNRSNNTWFGLVDDALIDPAITSLNGMAVTWSVTDADGEAGDNIMSFDDITLQGKQTVAISLNVPTNAVYSGSAQTVTPATTPSGVALVVKYNGSINAPVNAGTYTVTAEVVDTNVYYSAPTSGSLVVAKATPTITTNPVASGITYGQTLADSILSGGAGSVAGSFAFTSPTTAPNAGTNNQGVTFTPTDMANYNPATDTVSVVVAKATPTITAPPTVSALMQGQALSAATLSGGTASVPGSFAFTTPSTVPAVGTSSQSVTFTPTDSANYNTTTTSVNVVVAPHNLVLNGDFQQGNTNFTTDYTYNVRDSSSLLAEGSYHVVANAQNAHPFWASVVDHTFGNAAGKFLVANGSANTNQAVWKSIPISVTQSNVPYRFEAYITSVYPSTPPQLSFEIGDGTHWTPLGVTPSLVGWPTGKWKFTFADGKFSTPGTYYLRLKNSVSASGGNDMGVDDIYFGLRTEAPSFGSEPGVAESSLPIYDPSSSDRMGQTITFHALPSKTFGDAAFNLTATGGGSGNPVTYSSSNTNVATVAGSTVTIVGAGSTTITANQTGNGTYNAAVPVNQTLTVAQASQTITFNALPAKTFGDADFLLTATASSGLAVTYTSSNPGVATVSGSTVTVVGVGATVITASQAGDGNYLAAADVTQTLTVNSVLGLS